MNLPIRLTDREIVGPIVVVAGFAGCDRAPAKLIFAGKVRNGFVPMLRRVSTWYQIAKRFISNRNGSDSARALMRSPLCKVFASLGVYTASARQGVTCTA